MYSRIIMYFVKPTTFETGKEIEYLNHEKVSGLSISYNGTLI